MQKNCLTNVLKEEKWQQREEAVAEEIKLFSKYISTTKFEMLSGGEEKINKKY